MNKNDRLWYIDNLRIFLISLVVIHHLAITYGAPGSWYYNESEAELPVAFPLAMFVASNQAFFMGMFFFIAAFFIHPSLKKKGTGRYLGERLMRLGIPLLLFYFFISPLSVFVIHRFIYIRDVTLVDYLSKGYGAGFGPMWFVEALLLFTMLFLLVKPYVLGIRLPFPGAGKILAAAIITGLLQFTIRIWYPVGWSMPFTNFQFPFFIQYIFMFVLGITAWQNNWLESLTVHSAKRWFLFSQVIIFIGFPLLFIFGGVAQSGIEPFMGGLTWQNLGYALWEQLLGFSFIIGLTGLFKEYLNSQGKIARFMSKSAYAVFIIHTLVLVSVSSVFVSWQAPQLVKLVSLAPLALIICFLFAGLLQKIPLLNRIL